MLLAQGYKYIIYNIGHGNGKKVNSFIRKEANATLPCIFATPKFYGFSKPILNFIYCQHGKSKPNLL